MHDYTLSEELSDLSNWKCSSSHMHLLLTHYQTGWVSGLERNVGLSVCQCSMLLFGVSEAGLSVSSCIETTGSTLIVRQVGICHFTKEWEVTGYKPRKKPCFTSLHRCSSIEVSWMDKMTSIQHHHTLLLFTVTAGDSTKTLWYGWRFFKTLCGCVSFYARGNGGEVQSWSIWSVWLCPSMNLMQWDEGKQGGMYTSKPSHCTCELHVKKKYIHCR